MEFRKMVTITLCTEAWRGLALAHVTWPWEIGRAELGGCLGVGMCVVAGPRPGQLDESVDSVPTAMEG